MQFLNNQIAASNESLAHEEWDSFFLTTSCQVFDFLVSLFFQLNMPQAFDYLLLGCNRDHEDLSQAVQCMMRLHPKYGGRRYNEGIKNDFYLEML